MKNVMKAALFAAALLFVMPGIAGTVRRDTSITKKAGHTAKKVGDQTANTAANTASHVVDKRYEGKYGPHGESVYINGHSKYYYIDKKGHRVYLKESELMDKKVK